MPTDATILDALEARYRKDPERDLRIYKMRLKGVRHSELAAEYGISEQRIRQVYGFVRVTIENLITKGEIDAVI